AAIRDAPARPQDLRTSGQTLIAPDGPRPHRSPVFVECRMNVAAIGLSCLCCNIAAKSRSSMAPRRLVSPGRGAINRRLHPSGNQASARALPGAPESARQAEEALLPTAMGVRAPPSCVRPLTEAEAAFVKRSS